MAARYRTCHFDHHCTKRTAAAHLIFGTEPYDAARTIIARVCHYVDLCYYREKLLIRYSRNLEPLLSVNKDKWNRFV